MSKFNLNEYIANVSLDTINVDTNFEFDENIVPLVTSVLEIDPHIINAKRYCNVNSESIIIIGNKNELPNKSQISYPCFFSDLQQNKLNIQNIQGYTKKLITTLETNFIKSQSETDADKYTETEYENDIFENKVLIRMYNLENKKGEYGNCILNEEELIIFVWSWEYANFQIIINKQTPNKCQLQINVYVTEENKIITSKLENINNIIEKINKIKNEMVSRLQ
jgi:hypothetical protein